ncbi:MAG: D-isomer specific 2-hydroxyacid dehydrogenase family protein [Acidimicrobiia bacterium]
MPPHPNAPRVAVAPAGTPDWYEEAIVAGGGVVSPVAEADALLWGNPRNVADLADLLKANHHLTWVQLPYAGIENFAELIEGDDPDRIWTCGKGVYAEPVAEMALTLALAGMRGIGTYGRATGWSGPRGTNLQGARVTILGGGGITEVLLRLLEPFDCHVTVVRNQVQAMEGADMVVESEHLHSVLPGSDLVVLALALTPDTEGIISADELALLEPHTWIVNVARGRHIVTDDLVEALRDGVIGGAGLDVTDPEPLPDGHPLWTLPNCIITPHVGNTPDMAKPLLARRLTENVRRFAEGEELIGLVDPDAGY